MKKITGLFALMVVLLAFNGCKKEEEEPTPEPAPTPAPVAAFSVSNDNCNGPCTVTFTNSSTNATSNSWNFGDGSAASTAASPSHLYSSAGTYTVTLTATGAGGTNSMSKTVTIVNPYYFRVKINGTQFNASVITAERGSTTSPRSMTITGSSTGGGNPKFKIYMEETFIGFVDGIQGTFSSSSYPEMYMEYTDASGNMYSTQYDSNGMYIFFSEITYSSGGAVEAAQTSFSGSMKTSGGTAITVTEGNFKTVFSN